MADLTVPSQFDEGFAAVERAGPRGMIALRADLGAAALRRAVRSATGCQVPRPRAIIGPPTRARGEDAGAPAADAIAWMSPDEVLIFLPKALLPEMLAALEAALAGQHATVADVSDARALFRIRGARADQVISKLCPVDLAALPAGEIRRTRAAQTGVAIWRSGAAELSLICFRSVAGYVEDLLRHAARRGSETDPA